MGDTEKPCGCEVVDIQFCGPDDVDYTICYCPLHAAAPIGLKLAKAVLAIRRERDVLAETIPDIAQWLNIVQLARRIVEAAEPKGNQ